LRPGYGSLVKVRHAHRYCFNRRNELEPARLPSRNPEMQAKKSPQCERAQGLKRV
jgi:hypothetical protein